MTILSCHNPCHCIWMDLSSSGANSSFHLDAHVPCTMMPTEIGVAAVMSRQYSIVPGVRPCSL